MLGIFARQHSAVQRFLRRVDAHARAQEWQDPKGEILQLFSRASVHVRAYAFKIRCVRVCVCACVGVCACVCVCACACVCEYVQAWAMFDSIADPHPPKL